jgi:DNA-binding XRE family transcriptional regulator/tetratricopeptide (TPR) repeat protein
VFSRRELGYVEEEDGRSFGTRLRGLRKRERLTLEGLADASGVNERTISDLERGRSLGPHRRTVMALADGLRLADAERQDLEQLAVAGRPRPVTAPAGWCVPPRPVPDFTGRTPELARVASAATVQSGPAIPVIVLSGPGGSGKTTLAIEAARRLSDESGWHVLYLDLRGMDPAPLDPGTALFRLLRALNVGNRDMPDDVAGRAGQFRTLLASRPAVVVLDNARDEEQVRPLLPGGGSGLVMVTSRRLLTGLEGVQRLSVPVLSTDEATGLLRAIVGDDPDGVRHDGLERVAELCGGLPLAVRIVGNRLATRPSWTPQIMAERLNSSERRLDQIKAGDMQLTAAFGMSFEQLSKSARRLCRCLSLVPGPDFTVALASVLMERSVIDTEDLLEELHELGLLSQFGVRYGFHDLIRLFARERLEAEESPAEQLRLTRAAAEWLLDVTVKAGRWFEPEYGEAADTGEELVDLSSSEAAQDWLVAEGENWFRAAHIARENGWNQPVVDAAEALHWFSDHWQSWGHWAEVFGMAAEALGDRVAQATQLNYLSWAQNIGGERELATETALRAAEIAQEAGCIRQCAWAFFYAAWAGESGDLELALVHALESERLFAQTKDFEGRIQALSWTSNILTLLNRPHEALEKLTMTLGLLDGEQSNPARQLIAGLASAAVQGRMAMAYEKIGDDGMAEAAWLAAIETARRTGVPTQYGNLAMLYAQLLHRLGRVGEAVVMLQQAREKYHEEKADQRIAQIDALVAEWEAEGR